MNNVFFAFVFSILVCRCYDIYGFTDTSVVDFKSIRLQYLISSKFLSKRIYRFPVNVFDLMNNKQEKLPYLFYTGLRAIDARLFMKNWFKIIFYSDYLIAKYFNNRYNEMILFKKNKIYFLSIFNYIVLFDEFVFSVNWNTSVLSIFIIDYLKKYPNSIYKMSLWHSYCRVSCILFYQMYNDILFRFWNFRISAVLIRLNGLFLFYCSFSRIILCDLILFYKNMVLV